MLLKNLGFEWDNPELCSAQPRYNVPPGTNLTIVNERYNDAT